MPIHLNKTKTSTLYLHAKCMILFPPRKKKIKITHKREIV